MAAPSAFGESVFGACEAAFSSPLTASVVPSALLFSLSPAFASSFLTSSEEPSAADPLGLDDDFLSLPASGLLISGLLSVDFTDSVLPLSCVVFCCCPTTFGGSAGFGLC